MTKLYESLVVRYIYIIGFILVIGVAYVGYDLYSTSLGYVDYIPNGKEEYKDLIYSLEAEKIDFEEAIYKLFGIIPENGNKTGSKERTAIIATLLTLHEEFYEKKATPQNNNFYKYGWPYFIALEVKNTKKSKSSEFADLFFLRKQAIKKLETETTKIINIYKNSPPRFYQHVIPFLSVVSELNEELESTIYWQYIEELEVLIEKVRRQRQSEIDRLKEEIRQFKDNEVGEEKVKQKKEYLEILEKRKMSEEKLIKKIEKNIEKEKTL